MENVSANPPVLRNNATATNIILVINIALYALLEYKGGPTYENLILFGAKENGLIASGEWFRLISPIFLHAGLMHLGFNMWALHQVGRVLEFMIGPRNFVILYVAGGITSTLCSFALSPALSVGASGCLYAVLLALFVLQRYEESLAKDLGIQVPRSPLGMLIVLNGLITFVIPNIDWAAHLGGAIAGTLLGLSIVMRHRWRMRLERCRPFLDPFSPPPNRRFWEQPRLFVGVLVIINFLFLVSYYRVTELDRSFGQGMLQSARIQEPARSGNQLPQFGKLITSDRSETNPRMLSQVAAEMHQRNLYLPAFLTYHAVLLIAENESGTLTRTEVIALQALMDSAFRSESGSPLLFDAVLHADVLESNDLTSLIEKTAAASELLGQLRFFQIAAKLAEAAYVLDANQQGNAVKAFAYLKKLDDFSDLMRFREIADQLMPSQLDPALATSPPDQAAVAAMRAKGLKSVADFYPAQMWTLRSTGNKEPRDQDLLESTPKQEEQNLLPPI